MRGPRQAMACVSFDHLVSARWRLWREDTRPHQHGCGISLVHLAPPTSSGQKREPWIMDPRPEQPEPASSLRPDAHHGGAGTGCSNGMFPVPPGLASPPRVVRSPAGARWLLWGAGTCSPIVTGKGL